MLKSFYVDDFLKSVPSEDQAKQFCQEMIEVMVAGGFNLTKFKSNSPDVLGSLPDDKETTQKLTKNKLSQHWELAGGQLMTASHSPRALQYAMTK